MSYYKLPGSDTFYYFGGEPPESAIPVDESKVERNLKATVVYFQQAKQRRDSSNAFRKSSSKT